MRSNLRGSSVIASTLALLAIAAMGTRALSQNRQSAEQERGEDSAPRLNMVGSYGPWLADKVLGEGPARLSFRTSKWKSLDEWRSTARARVWECMAPVDLGGTPEVRVESTHEFDGLTIQRLSWQLPCGPRTEAVLLKPIGASGRLPGVLALHDHGGNK